MKPLAETQGYRGIEYGVHNEGEGLWQWAYYPKLGTGVVERGQVKGTGEMAITACKAAIDQWLGPKNSN